MEKVETAGSSRKQLSLEVIGVMSLTALGLLTSLLSTMQLLG